MVELIAQILGFTSGKMYNCCDLCCVVLFEFLLISNGFMVQSRDCKCEHLDMHTIYYCYEDTRWIGLEPLLSIV